MATKDNFFQTSDGLWLYYEIHGCGKPILFLPGFGESLKMWRHSVPVLSRTHQVVCLDLRGHGRSMKAVSYTHLDVYKRQYETCPRSVRTPPDPDGSPGRS